MDNRWTKWKIHGIVRYNVGISLDSICFVPNSFGLPHNNENCAKDIVVSKVSGFATQNEFFKILENSRVNLINYIYCYSRNPTRIKTVFADTIGRRTMPFLTNEVYALNCIKNWLYNTQPWINCNVFVFKTTNDSTICYLKRSEFERNVWIRNYIESRSGSSVAHNASL